MTPDAREIGRENGIDQEINITDFAKRSGLLDYLADQIENEPTDINIPEVFLVDRDRAKVAIYKNSKENGGEVTVVMDYFDKGKGYAKEYSLDFSELKNPKWKYAGREPMPEKMYEDLRAYIKINYPLVWLE